MKSFMTTILLAFSFLSFASVPDVQLYKCKMELENGASDSTDVAALNNQDAQ